MTFTKDQIIYAASIIAKERREFISNIMYESSKIEYIDAALTYYDLKLAQIILNLDKKQSI